jgi:hypothetical protein
MEQDWWYVLRKVALHTLNNGAAIFSFMLLSYLMRRGISDCVLLAILDKIEGIVLIVLVLIFAGQVIYDVLPEKIRVFFTSKLVLA